MAFKNLSGMKFGSLFVLERTTDYVASSGRKYPQYICLCDCGNKCLAIAQSLTCGKKTNCGCLTHQLRSDFITQRNTVHGDGNRMGKRNRLYGIWCGMKNRCYNSNDPTYARYGAKGITVCDEWRNDYSAFRDWAMSNGYDFNAPRGVCTIDRIDSTKGYSPKNCRFVSALTQNDNRSSVIHIEYNGETHSLSQWANILGINRTTLTMRYRKGLRGNDLFYKGRLPRK